MTPEAVDALMNDFQSNRALVMYLEQREIQLRKEAESIADTQADDLISISQNWSTDPHGTSISCQTENAAIALADSDPIRRSQAILKEANAIQKRIEGLYRDIRYVEAWLTALNPKERIVVENKVIHHLYWREVAVYVEKEFGLTYTAVGLKKIHRRAMEKIYNLAAQ